MQLLDTCPDYIEALVRHPDVEDTNDIDRHAYSVPADVSYGTRWIWVRDRLPVRDWCHRVRVRQDRTS
jgi:hypothetical protein